MMTVWAFTTVWASFFVIASCFVKWFVQIGDFTLAGNHIFDAIESDAKQSEVEHTATNRISSLYHRWPYTYLYWVAHWCWIRGITFWIGRYYSQRSPWKSKPKYSLESPWWTTWTPYHRKSHELIQDSPMTKQKMMTILFPFINSCGYHFLIFSVVSCSDDVLRNVPELPTAKPTGGGEIEPWYWTPEVVLNFGVFPD